MPRAGRRARGAVDDRAGAAGEPTRSRWVNRNGPRWLTPKVSSSCPGMPRWPAETGVYQHVGAGVVVEERMGLARPRRGRRDRGRGELALPPARLPDHRRGFSSARQAADPGAGPRQPTAGTRHAVLLPVTLAFLPVRSGRVGAVMAVTLADGGRGCNRAGCRHVAPSRSSRLQRRGAVRRVRRVRTHRHRVRRGRLAGRPVGRGWLPVRRRQRRHPDRGREPQHPGTFSPCRSIRAPRQHPRLRLRRATPAGRRRRAVATPPSTRTVSAWSGAHRPHSTSSTRPRAHYAMCSTRCSPPDPPVIPAPLLHPT